MYCDTVVAYLQLIGLLAIIIFYILAIHRLLDYCEEHNIT